MKQRSIILWLIACVLGAGSGLFAWAVVPVIQPVPALASTTILDKDGGVLYQVADSQTGVRESVQLADMPLALKQAVIAAEDARFYQHRGVDMRALIRALFNRIVYGAPGGASTIEQQLVKSTYFAGRSRTFPQKIREAIAATYWSFAHSKDDTLEQYLNTVYFGNRAYGVSAAAKTYFNKDLRDLSRGECALLIGLLPAPSRYDPFRHWTTAVAQQARVADRLVATDALTEQDRQEVMAMPIALVRSTSEIRAPHFVFAVLDQLEETHPDIHQGGYVVRTTLDPSLQRMAEATVERRLSSLAEEQVGNAAVLALDPRSGDVLAYVGSNDYFDESIDGAVDMVRAKRQPGSALKPFLYFTSFMQGFTPGSVVADLPTRFATADGRSYYPRNYNYRYFGPVTIREALGSSLNIPAVKVLDLVGLQSFHSAMKVFGVTFPESPEHYGLGVVLGGGEVSLFDAAKAYGMLALYGQSVEASMVQQVVDAHGAVLYVKPPAKHAPLFADDHKAKQSAALIADVLSDPLARTRSFGEANLLDVGKSVAVKTGTTKDFRDNWAFGYTPDFVLGVWVGNADNTPMRGVTGITGAVPIWYDIMARRYEGASSVRWPDVEGLVRRSICLPSGMLADDVCLKRRDEVFIVGTEPSQDDTWYKVFDIDAGSGTLANASCQRHVVKRTYLVPPPEYAAWIAQARNEQPPSIDCSGTSAAPVGMQPTILSPLDGDIFEIDPFIDVASQQIPFIAGGSQAPYLWLLNGKTISSNDSVYFWTPIAGEYTLDFHNRQIRFTVR